jgi:hypothetical protein
VPAPQAAPVLITRRAPPPPNVPFPQRQKAMPPDAGRPLEPRQIENLRAGKPAGARRDSEYPSHQPAGQAAPAPRRAAPTAPQPAARPSPRPATPAPKPATPPEPTSKPAAKPATTLPAPVDLEKLAEPKPKGGKKE